MSQEPLKSPESASKSTPSSPTATSASVPNNAHHSRLNALLRMLGQLWGIILALVPALVDLLRQLWQITLLSLKWVSKQWTLILPKLRTVLPTSLNKLPDSALTGIAIALLVGLFLLPRALLPNRPPAIAETPTGTETVEKPSVPQPPAPRPNPNAKRLATIQNQLIEVTTPYAEDLVQAVQADFAKGRLLLSVTSRWNTLEASQREQLANELLKRSKKLKFEQLDITDIEGTLLARSPVIGTQMVLLAGTKAA